MDLGNVNQGGPVKCSLFHFMVLYFGIVGGKFHVRKKNHRTHFIASSWVLEGGPSLNPKGQLQAMKA